MITIKKRNGGYTHLYMNWYEYKLNEAWFDFLQSKITIEQYNKIKQELETMENQKAQLDTLRVNLDGLAQLVSTIKGNPTMIRVNDQVIENLNLYELKKSLFMAKAWTGKLLGELGVESPYSVGKSTITDIEPTDAKAKLDGSTEGVSIDVEVWEQYNEIQKLDVLRQVLKNIAEEVKLFNSIEPIQLSREANICRTNVWNYLHEASIYAGFRLGEIRDEDTK